MRTKLIIATTAGALALGGGLAVAVPALADEDASPSAPREDRIRDALAGLVEDGSLTDEQAGEVAATLAESGEGGHGGHGGPGGHGGGRFGLSVAATALDLTEDELRTALESDGTSLADVAEQQGVAVGALVDALVQDREERIAEAVADGELTQEQADERLADLEERITERVSRDAVGPHGRGGPRGDREGADDSGD
ncbi:hypothetical protein [Blastococcus xanthinilyticus]|uniref:Uncharacterized protein n=1 Tax=Blastococcus xanthinilyticus TaxID=1564164 RepID=A0A5S5CZN5_9ACTN|nr:hypothetical protein [Blastococcus xanthinilyticus]TYP89221.1 hypothetical protein BD833_103378 [Blastococcus xanthinilyticus]